MVGSTRAEGTRGGRAATAGATLRHLLGLGAAPRHPAPESELVDLAIEHRVGALLLERATVGLTAASVERLRAACRSAARGHLAAMQALRTIFPVLEAARVPHLVVKGPILQAAWGAATRPYLDVDLVVPPAHLARTLDLLGDLGATTIDRNWDLLIRERRAEIHLLLPGGTPVDLHWHLVNHGEQRDRLDITVDELLATARAVEVAGVAVPTIGAAEAVVHTCLHAAVSGGHHLLWLIDIACLLAAPAERGGGADADEILAVARRWRAGLPVAAMLHRASRTVGADIDDDLVDALAPSPAQRALVRGLATWRPSGRLPGGGSTDRAVARSLRPTVPGTARAAVREGRSMLGRLVDHHEYWTDPSDPRHVQFDRSGSGLDAYLAMAAVDR